MTKFMQELRDGMQLLTSGRRHMGHRLPMACSSSYTCNLISCSPLHFAFYGAELAAINAEAKVLPSQGLQQINS